MSELTRSSPGLWVKIWVSANEANPNENAGLYTGIYVLFGVLTEISLAIETLYVTPYEFCLVKIHGI